MKTGIIVALTAIALTACTASAPPAPRGAGFDDFSEFELERARREAQLSGERVSIIPPPQVTPVPAPQIDGPISSSDLAAAGIGTAPATNTQAPMANSATDPTRVQGVDASPLNPAPVLANNKGISDEQNFDAVANRETIQSDAERRAAQAAARLQVAPTAVPERPSNTGPNIVEYALNAPNVKGQEWYSRSILAGESRFQRNCARYGSADEAQRDFLARGGPDRDRLGIDPDGDGFACGWDPAPFKAAVGN